eukprot:TRINITY_DN15307_c0_g1_i1.p2 TRINITY_DN15307_c0_g1~~TRINITY_DN15307_c0_g1_i1.p2  ORF type:complete len:381 (+),score=92.78 TRINITY_DN15307_c0_g1_i1:36-1178(+)
MEEYFKSHEIQSILHGLLVDMGKNRPEYPLTHMIAYLKNHPRYQQEKEKTIEKEADESTVEEKPTEEEAPPTPIEQKEVAPRPMRRRGGVSAEPIDQNAPFQSRIIPKSSEQRERLEGALKSHVMFISLDKEQKKEVYDAMEEVSYESEDVIIRQGDPGDNFYVVEEGECNIYVKGQDPSEQSEDPKNYGTLVGTIGRNRCFGELALMYGSPRAATITARTTVKLWALDRVSFRSILMQTTLHQRKLYEKFLGRVPILQGLTNWERMTVADALEQRTFAEEEIVIREGEAGHSFYIVIEGEARVYNKQNGATCIAKVLQSDYFGELALLTDRPRAATVIAYTPLKCAVLTRECFNRVLGPCEDILRRNMDRYKQYMTEKI